MTIKKERREQEGNGVRALYKNQKGPLGIMI